MSEDLTKKLSELPKDKLEELIKKLGLRIEIITSVKCLYCDAKFESKINERKVQEKLNEHLDKKCKVKLWIETSFKPKTIMRDIGLWIELSEKLKKGNISREEINQFRELSKKILK